MARLLWGCSIAAAGLCACTGGEPSPALAPPAADPVVSTEPPVSPDVPVDAAVLLHLPFDGEAAGWVRGGLPVVVPEGLTYVEGVRDRAVLFDGHGRKVEVTGGGSLPIEDAFTLEMWLQSWGENPVRRAITSTCFNHTSTITLGVQAQREPKLRARLTLAGRDDRVELFAPITLEGRPWIHAAFTYDGSRAALYIDGALVDGQACSGSVDMKPKLSVGVGTWHRTNQAFYGLIDEVRLLSRALPPDEVAERAARD